MSGRPVQNTHNDKYYCTAPQMVISVQRSQSPQRMQVQLENDSSSYLIPEDDSNVRIVRSGSLKKVSYAADSSDGLDESVHSANYRLEDSNKNNTLPVDSLNRSSQESLYGTSSSNELHRDVLPLPIEIPEYVTEDEFRRYLSVRRGAISSDRVNIPFEKRRPASFESLGRRPRRRSSVGMSPSNRALGHDASKRTASISHAIMTLALLSSSICQLRYLITYSSSHSYPILNYFLLFTSIIIEVAAGIGYIIVARCNFDEDQTETIYNYLIFALFIVAVSNVVLAAFAFDDHICDEKKTNSQPSTLTQDQQINQPVSRSDQVMDLRYMPLE